MITWHRHILSFLMNVLYKYSYLLTCFHTLHKREVGKDTPHNAIGRANIVLMHSIVRKSTEIDNGWHFNLTSADKFFTLEKPKR